MIDATTTLERGHMGKLGAFRGLLYSLSRLPGLGFLSSSASAVGKVERAGRNVENVKKAADKLKPEEKKEEQPEEATEDEKKDE